MKDWTSSEETPWHPMDSNNKVTSVVIKEGVTNIGNYAFKLESQLTSVIIPYGVTSIGDYAFCWCERLTDINGIMGLPNTVSSIGNYAFSSCKKLERNKSS